MVYNKNYITTANTRSLNLFKEYQNTTKKRMSAGTCARFFGF